MARYAAGIFLITGTVFRLTVPLLMLHVFAGASWAQPDDGDDPTPHLRLNISGHTAPINAIAFSPDSRLLYTAGDDKAVHVWRRDAVDANQNAAGSAWASVSRLRWEVGSDHAGRIHGLAVAPHAGYVAVAGHGNRAAHGEIVWLDPNSGNFVASYFPKDPGDAGWQPWQHEQTVWSVEFSPDGNWFASADVDGRVLAWHGEGAATANPQAKQLRPPVHQLYGPDADKLKNVAVEVTRRPIAFVGSNRLAFSQLRKVSNVQVFGARQRAKVGFWQIQLAELNAANPSARPNLMILPGDFKIAVTAMASSRDGRYLVAAGPEEFVLYDLQQHGQPEAFPLEGPRENAIIYSLAFTPDGKYLAVGREREGGGKIDLWDVTQRKKTTWSDATPSVPVMACAFSPDGRYLAYVSGSGTEVSVGLVEGGQVTAIQKLKGGEQIAEAGFEAVPSGDRKRYRIVFSTGAPANPQQRRWHVFDPDQDGDARITALPQGQQPRLYVGNYGGWTATLGATTNQLVLRNSNQPRAQIVLDRLQGEEFTTYRWIGDKQNPGGPPIGIAVATTPANFIFVYRLPAGNAGRLAQALAPLRVYRGHEGRINSLHVSPDQQYLISGAADGTVSIWPLYDSGRAWSKWGITFANDGRTIRELDELGPLFIRGLRVGDVLEKISWFEGEAHSHERRERTTAGEILDALKSAPLTRDIVVQARRGNDQVDTQSYPGWYPILSLYVHDGEWIAWSPTGHYDSSAGGERLIGWQFTQQLGQPPFFATAQQYYREFHRPELIQELLHVAAIPETAEPIAKNKIPVIRLLNPEPGDINQRTVRIEAEITPPFESGTLTVSPTVDGIACDPEQLTFNNGSPVRWRREVTLNDHIHHDIGVRVDSTNSRLAQVRWIPHDSELASEPKPGLHVLAVGISDYSGADSAAANAFPNLEDARRDAESIAYVFKSQKASYYERDVDPKVLINADSQTIEAELSKLMKPVSEGGPSGIDTVVFYFAGHGDIDSDGAFCLVTKEGKSTQLTSRKLLRDFCTTGRFRKLLILDTCHSGAAWDDISDDWQRLKRRGLRGGWPANFFAACHKGQKALDPKGGLFTFCLLRGLEGEALTGQRPYSYIDVRHLEEFLPGRIEFEIAQLNLRTNNKLAQRDKDSGGAFVQTPVIWTDEPADSDVRRNWKPLQLTTPKAEFKRSASLEPAVR
jgi:WD40 repeat protein